MTDISAQRFENPTTFFFDQIQVNNHGCVFSGPGVGRWEPGRGLQIEGVLKLVRGSLPPQIAFRPLEIPGPSSRCTIKLRMPRGNRGIVFCNHIPSQVDLIRFGHFRANADEVIFSSRDPASQIDSIGNLSYRGRFDASLPDTIAESTTIGTQEFCSKYARCLNYDADDCQVRIISSDEESHTIRWHLPRDQHKRHLVPEWPRGLALAWQFCNASTIWPFVSEFSDGRRRVTVIHRQCESTHLGHLSFLGPAPKVTGKMFVALAELFSLDRPESVVARSLLAHCLECVNLNTMHAISLTVGVALEAVIRTLYNTPFYMGAAGRKFKKREQIEALISDYFETSWRNESPRLLATFDRVRHRAAHPDWIHNAAGRGVMELSDSSLDDIIYLSRFYGYLIMAFAGIRSQTPVFPKPVREWQPRMTWLSKPGLTK